jgi:hypothetical protein
MIQFMAQRWHYVECFEHRTETELSIVNTIHTMKNTLLGHRQHHDFFASHPQLQQHFSHHLIS